MMDGRIEGGWLGMSMMPTPVVDGGSMEDRSIVDGWEQSMVGGDNFVVRNSKKNYRQWRSKQ